MAVPDRLLEDGDHADFPGWRLRAVHTPGHTPGHLCFAEEDARLFFSGDHVLPRISPNISTTHDGAADPLGDYLDSLAAVRDRTPPRCCPAHEWRFRGLADRVDALTAHHEHRLTELLAAIRSAPALDAVGPRGAPDLVAAVGAVRAADADLRGHRDRRPPAPAGQPWPGHQQRRTGADVDPRRPLTTFAGLAERVLAAPPRLGAPGWSASTGRPARARPRSPGGSPPRSATAPPWCTSRTSTRAGR